MAPSIPSGFSLNLAYHFAVVGFYLAGNAIIQGRLLEEFERTLSGETKDLGGQIKEIRKDLRLLEVDVKTLQRQQTGLERAMDLWEKEFVCGKNVIIFDDILRTASGTIPDRSANLSSACNFKTLANHAGACSGNGGAKVMNTLKHQEKERRALQELRIKYKIHRDHPLLAIPPF